jgi:hypothetical protein
MKKMKLFRKIQITAACMLTLAGLLLYGCSQQADTTSTPAAAPISTNDMSAVVTNSAPASQNDVPAVVTNSAPAVTNEVPAGTTNSALLPESALPISTNPLPAATPIPATQ